MGSIPVGSTKKKRPHGLFFLVPRTGIPFPRDLSRRVRKFSAKPKTWRAKHKFLRQILSRLFLSQSKRPFPRGLPRRVRKFSAKPKTWRAKYKFLRQILSRLFLSQSKRPFPSGRVSPSGLNYILYRPCGLFFWCPWRESLVYFTATLERFPGNFLYI